MTNTQVSDPHRSQSCPLFPPARGLRRNRFGTETSLSVLTGTVEGLLSPRGQRDVRSQFSMASLEGSAPETTHRPTSWPATEHATLKARQREGALQFGSSSVRRRVPARLQTSHQPRICRTRKIIPTAEHDTRDWTEEQTKRRIASHLSLETENRREGDAVA